MTQEQDTTEQQPDPESTPHDDELDIEGPNESAPGHHPDEEQTGS